jgi:RNA polymerase sigma factor for flagellar operon FliA
VNSPPELVSAPRIRTAPTRRQDQRYSTAELDRNELIEQYLSLVGSVLAKLRYKLPPHVDADELHSAGVTGLIAAVARYDSAQASTFAGYARVRIQGAMLDELRRQDPCSRRARVRCKTIQRVVLEAEQALGRAPSDREISERLHISVTQLEQWREAAEQTRTISLDLEAEGDSSKRGSLHATLADDSHVCVRDTIEKRELLELISVRIAALPDRQKRILAFYYSEGMRFAEIAAVFDLTESRICQLHQDAVKTLQAFIRKMRKEEPRHV